MKFKIIIISTCLMSFIILAGACYNGINTLTVLGRENHKLKLDIGKSQLEINRLNSIISKTPIHIDIKTVYDGVNNERLKVGLSALTINKNLEVSACAKASDMIANNYWGHTAPDGTEPWVFITSSGYNYTKAGENLAKGFNTTKGVIDGWMTSTSHRENILGSFTDIGICMLESKAQEHKGDKESVNLIVNHFGR